MYVLQHSLDVSVEREMIDKKPGCLTPFDVLYYFLFPMSVKKHAPAMLVVMG